MTIVLPKLLTIEEVTESVRQGIAETTGFELTNAVCPINEFGLWAGFQRATYFDEVSGQLHVVIITQTRSLLFDLLTDLIEELLRIEKIKRAGFDIVLESRHIPDKETGFGKKYDCCKPSHFFTDFLVRHVDPVSFLSELYDFEDLLINDGFTGLSYSVMDGHFEFRFDVHKAISRLFSKHPKLVDRIVAFLKKRGLVQLPIKVNTLAEQPHIHIGHSLQRQILINSLIFSALKRWHSITEST